MSSFLITADEHYGHDKIRIHCSRPFESVRDMNEAIIAKHNAKVPNSEGFLTIHVGDMFWHTMTKDEAMNILKRLHGRHAFLFGNHDELIEKYKEIFATKFDFIKGENKAGGAMILHYNKHKITLNHFAQRVWEASHKGSWMLYGHSHNELPVIGKSFDVGVDGHNFEPWTLEEIEAKMETLECAHIIKKPWPGKELVKGAGSTVHSHIPGETCGFCRFDSRTKL